MDSSYTESVFLPLAAIALVFGMPIGAFVIFRVLAHRERMAMIAAGLPLDGASRHPLSYAEREHTPESARVTLNKGIRLALIGFALTLGLTIATVHWSQDDFSWRPGPWLLIGLLPLFIGVAQVLIGILSGARVDGPSRGSIAAPVSPQGAPMRSTMPDSFEFQPPATPPEL